MTVLTTLYVASRELIMHNDIIIMKMIWSVSFLDNLLMYILKNIVKMPPKKQQTPIIHKTEKIYTDPLR